MLSLFSILVFDRVEENGDTYYWIRNRVCNSVVIHILRTNGVLSLSQFGNLTMWKKMETPTIGFEIGVVTAL